MAAEVGSLFHFLSGYKEDQQKIKAEDPNIPITRDLLGGSKELDLDLDFQVPNGWEKRLDLKVRKIKNLHCLLVDLWVPLKIEITEFLFRTPAVRKSLYATTLQFSEFFVVIGSEAEAADIGFSAPRSELSSESC